MDLHAALAHGLTPLPAAAADASSRTTALSTMADAAGPPDLAASNTASTHMLCLPRHPMRPLCARHVAWDTLPGAGVRRQDTLPL